MPSKEILGSKKILIIANHLLTPKISSGGDRIFVEMAKRWKDYGAEIVVVAPEIAIETVAVELGVARTIVVSRSPLDRLSQRVVAAILPFIFGERLKFLGS